MAVGQVSSHAIYDFTQETMAASISGVQSVLLALRRMRIPLVIFVMHLRSLKGRGIKQRKQKERGSRDIQDTSMSSELTLWTSIHLRVLEIRIHLCLFVQKPGLYEFDWKSV